MSVIDLLPAARPEGTKPSRLSVEQPVHMPLVAGRYRVLGALGTGGTAVVHRALDVHLGREVALKVLRSDADTEINRERLADEARLLAHVSIPGVPRLLDAGDRPSHLVMELVDGPDLARVLATGPLTPHRVAQIGADVATALSSVHALGVVHRDVKPGNLLVGADRVHLADFGIAQWSGRRTRDLPGHTVGTVAFLAPEQVSQEEVTDRADVYALGLVLLEALTGRRAYPGKDDDAAYARLDRSPLIPTSLPAGWSALLHRMTRREPTQRPSAAEAAAILRDLASSGLRQVASPVSLLSAPVVDVDDLAQRADETGLLALDLMLDSGDRATDAERLAQIDAVRRARPARRRAGRSWGVPAVVPTGRRYAGRHRRDDLAG
ncbi:serine/threonine-protein kinase [Nocardioides sp. GY 10127]|uniref:serine/threonine-protein kinase n=1 Tax=Nocardioides sp. GY 10127 TaxID=2569762 RepID=UPI0010A863CC|nr:serine/threonine-protein kinase [Nocardioides sp. GY 10127]TIC79371.1 serine/threonine protein kinase [Nocardioides sp. GY 10127]